MLLRCEAAAKFAKENKIDLRTIELDVASQSSADAAIQKIVSDNGRLDVVGERDAPTTAAGTAGTAAL